MSPRSCSERGFTLLEVLVAISIVALVLATVYGVFASISAARERLGQDGESYQRARIIYDRLGRELRGLCPVGGSDRHGVFRTGNDGDGNPVLELTTSATAQSGAQQTGIALIRYTLAPDRDDPARKVLLRSEQSALVSDQVARESGTVRLASGILRMEWRFLVQDQWRTQLDVDQDGLPALAELTLTMADAQGAPLLFRSAFELPQINWR